MRMITALALAFVLAGVATLDGRAQSNGTPPPAQQPAAALLNLNTATQAELEKLPGVGAATAKTIIEYRQKNGGFKKIEELMNVKGIGEKSFLKLKPLVTVTPPKTGER